MRIYAGVLMLVLLGGCADARAPKCGDKQVTDLVIEIANKKLRDVVVSRAIVAIWGQSPASAGNPTYAQLEKNRDSDERTRRLLEAVDEKCASVKYELGAVRTERVDNEAKKCDCAADLRAIDGGTLPIKYAAYVTADGRVYVEVRGM